MTIPAETQKLMRLLSQVILADGHIRETEIAALIEGASALELKDSSGAPLSPDMIRHWFDDYLQELNRKWSTAPKDVTLTLLVLSLSEWPEKQAVVDVLEKISLADHDLHAEEKTLMSIVKSYWQYDGLNAPGSRIEG